MIAIVLSALLLAAVAGTALTVMRGSRRIASLADYPPWQGASAPRVSIVIPARNEAQGIEAAMRSVLALDYPDFEVIAVNDRSEDETGAILDRLHAAHPQLRVIHVAELPEGWLGKNHALHQGAAAATGKYILFTDADVNYEPSALARAVGAAEDERLDHLAIFPDVPASNPLLQGMMVNGVIGLYLLFRPWRPGRRFIGVGAFNLVRAETWRGLGGHERIRLEMIDDVMIGMVMRRAGAAQRLLVGHGLLSVEIYPGVGAMIRGLEKNMFAAMDYRVSVVLAVTAYTLAVGVWPWVGVLAFEGPVRWINAATLLAALVSFTDFTLRGGYGLPCILTAPLTPFLSLLILWRSALKALTTGTVGWRGTRYSLAELRRAHLPML